MAWPHPANQRNRGREHSGDFGKPLPPGDLITTKKYFKLLQAVHHSNIIEQSLSTGSPPPGMKKHAWKLTNFIKPSSPTAETLEKVAQNTANWLKTNIQILQEHYDQNIARGLEELPDFDPGAFNKAISWGRTRYKKKLTNTTLGTLKSLLQTSKNPPSDGTPPTWDETDFPSLTRGGTPEPVSTAVGEERTQHNKIRDSNKHNQTKINLPLNLPLSIQTPAEVMGKTVRAPSLGLKESRGERVADRKTLWVEASVEVRTHEEKDLSSQQEHSLGSTRSDDSSATISQLGKAKAPEKEREEVKNQEINVADKNKDVKWAPTSNVAVVADDLISSAPLAGSQGSGLGAERAPLRQEETLSGHEMMNVGQNTNDRHDRSGPTSEPPSNTTAVDLSLVPAPPSRSEPVRHRNTDRKIADWSLEVVKPIVIMGDSNLSRIPLFEDDRLQVDSFPGASFYHLRGVLQKLPPNPNVEKVVLAAGLNNCLSEQMAETTRKQLQLLLTMARGRFPNAEIYVPVINISDRLKEKQKGLLKGLNEYIVNKCRFLPELNPLRFETMHHDPVHWTPGTAKQILELWMDELNM